MYYCKYVYSSQTILWKPKQMSWAPIGTKRSVTYDRSVVSLGTPVSAINKIDRHDKSEILLKVALNTITLTVHVQKHLCWAKDDVLYTVDIKN